MNKYVRGLSGFVVGTVKTLVLKLERGKKFNINFPAIVSIGTEISVDKGGEFYACKRFSMRKGSRITVRSSGRLTIGKNFYMNTGCLISVHDSVTIGDNVEFGSGVLVYDQDHDFRVEGGLAAKKFKTSPVTIGNNVWIGANTVILRGTTIGDNCVVGAGSVIKGNFPPDSVIVQKRNTDVISVKALDINSNSNGED